MARPRLVGPPGAAVGAGGEFRNGYYQLGFWTGAGPSGTFTPAQDSPMGLSATGSG